MEITCFKAYDIRGQIPNELNADICYRVGNATAAFLDAKTVVVGRDMRQTSDEFADAVIKGLRRWRRGARHRHVRHGNGLFCDGSPQCRRRHHGHSQPQSG
jgi:hypothetical protein